MVSLTGLQYLSLGAAKGLYQESQAPFRQKDAVKAEFEDRLELSSKAKEIGKKQISVSKALPPFGRFHLGGPEPLPFGPDLNANILNRIPGDGIKTPAEGVQLGHHPARGLNILA